MLKKIKINGIKTRTLGILFVVGALLVSSMFLLFTENGNGEVKIKIILATMAIGVIIMIVSVIMLLRKGGNATKNKCNNPVIT